jgi:hypothetical protein
MITRLNREKQPSIPNPNANPRRDAPYAADKIIIRAGPVSGVVDLQWVIEYHNQPWVVSWMHG